MAQNTAERDVISEMGEREVKSAARTLEVLDLLSGPDTSWTIGAISRQLHIPKSSLHGILTTMRSRGWLSTDENTGRVRLGVRALATGYAYVENDESASLAQPVLDNLWDQTNEAVEYGRLDSTDIVYLAKRDSHSPVKMYAAVGRRLPSHTTALGKAILASIPPDQVRDRLTWPLLALTPQTIVDEGRLYDELEQIREAGFATDRGENELGVVNIAAALQRNPTYRDALSVAIPASRATPERIEEIARAVTRSAQLLDTVSGRRLHP